MKNMKRSVALLVAIALLIGCAAGGTIAWLMDTSDTVTNTFTTSDVNITLTESASAWDDADGNAYTNNYKMVPGAEIAKDPKVTVKANSEACWLFVKVSENNRVAGADYNFYDYEVASGWTKLDGITLNDGETVYYRSQAAVGTDTEYPVLKGNIVTVNNKVTKDNMETIINDSSKKPTLTFTAYAIQSENLVNNDAGKTPADTAAEAWALINS